jgi:hypothetical protein
MSVMDQNVQIVLDQYIAKLMLSANVSISVSDNSILVLN